MMYKSGVSAEHTKEIFTEMCRRVGVKYEDVDFSKKEWYYDHTWTDEQQNNFKKWLGKFLTKHKYTRGKYRRQDHGEYEAGKFLMDFGWRIKE